MKPFVRINHQIKANELRVIDEESGSLGVMTLTEALKRAEEKELDLIEISPEAKPPVAKIMDYGKYQYLLKKKGQAARGGSHATETKSIQVKIGTGDHDLELKAKKASEFLRDGHRVKVNLFLPGRTKYFDRNFLNERLERFLKFIAEDYKIARPAEKSPKGLALIIERAKKDKDKHENQPVID